MYVRAKYNFTENRICTGRFYGWHQTCNTEYYYGYKEKKKMFSLNCLCVVRVEYKSVQICIFIDKNNHVTFNRV